MSTKLVSPKGVDTKFKSGEGYDNLKGEKYIPSTQERGRMSTHESEDESGFRSPTKRGLKSGVQGEFSGAYDKEGHHLKSDGTPDMRFKENREEFTGQGYEYTSPARLNKLVSQFKQEEVAEASQGTKSGRQGEFRGEYDKEGHHLKAGGLPDMRFKENREEFEGKGYEYVSPRRINRPISQTQFEPQEKETRGRVRRMYSRGKMGRSQVMKSGRQGEFSGEYDKEGHHLKAGGLPDMRFKENREEFEGKGYEYVSPRRIKRPISQAKPKDIQYSKSRDTGVGGREMEVRTSQKPIMKTRPDSKLRIKQQKPVMIEKLQKEKAPTPEHMKSDGTPDMRFKDNRDSYTGQGYENLTTRAGRRTYSKSNVGLAEGNTPGEHSGKFDSKGHHLKQDGTPDMRFVENREEFSGQGYESPKDESGNIRKSPRYLRDVDDTFADKIFYRRKRPPTPYAIYIREKASLMKKQNPDMDMNEVFRELARQWRSSSDKEHKKYYDMYDDEVKRFEYTNQFPHRGPLAYRKFAQEHGLKIGGSSSESKKSKYERTDRNRREQDENDGQDEEEENQNPNEAITA